MKRYRKKEILETAELLIEANNYIANSYRRSDSGRIMEILSQCQEMAILLGNCLETLGDSGKVLVPVLEDYCEKIYQFSQNLSDEFICRKIAKQTTRQLAGLRKNIVDQIPEDKIEIVFLPYKASMWDSLESVWRAADEDPECDAYVVPIPYFERNQQGELATMHYEGDQFPDDVPVIHYMDYNMAERKPDVAFIHNPYDQYNHVTSIHPAYYVPELKKYVGKVAYIPYFISPEPIPNSIEAQEQKKGFVIEPGVLNSDLVFVQSEAMKQLYVNILEKEIPNVDRRYWEDKIFGFGSPKLDRVHSTKRNDDLLSPEWHSLIYDSTGNRKKVIFYNTSLHDLLNQKNMMEKIADTLAFFKGREDCTLWWRPHPLYESTLASMRPDLLPIYRKLVENYKAEGWGILDEGEDLDWAIAETDAYYGDRSSVVELYKEAGKPVLYQDTRVKNSVEDDVEFPIWPCAFCVDGDDIWFVHGKINLLMKYNKNVEKIEIIGTIPNESFFQVSLYQTIYKKENRIYFIPCWAREVAIFDVESNEFSKIKLKEIDKYKGKLLFSKCFVEKHALYCIPYCYDSILKIDLNTQEINYINISMYLGGRQNVYIDDAVRINGSIICVGDYLENILVFQLDKEKIKIETVNGEQGRYAKIEKLGDSLILFDANSNNIFFLSLDGKRENMVTVKYNQFKLSTVVEKLLILDAADVKEITLIDEKGRIRTREKSNTNERQSALGCDYFYGIVSKDGEFYFYFNTIEYILYKTDGEGIVEKYNFDKGIEMRKIKSIIESLFIASEENENELLILDEWIEKSTSIISEKRNWKQNGFRIKEFIKDIVDK